MQFWKFCLGENWVERNPMRHVDPAPVVRRPRLQLSAQELLAMLDAAEPRDRVALALGMNTGLRAGDIMALKVGDVNLSNNMLTAFIQKTSKYDDIPISSELRDELIRWFSHYGEAMGLADWQRDLPNEWTLVPPMHYQANNVWKPEMGGQVVYRPAARYTHPETIVQRALAKLDYPTKGEGFHTLRRSTARRFYELALAENISDPIRMAQALLGHQRRNTTEIYLGLTVEKEMRDDLLRGKSFLRRVADDEIANRESGTPKTEGGQIRSA
jgi:integrase